MPRRVKPLLVLEKIQPKRCDPNCSFLLVLDRRLRQKHSRRQATKGRPTTRCCSADAAAEASSTQTTRVVGVGGAASLDSAAVAALIRAALAEAAVAAEGLVAAALVVLADLVA
jgi:hypothetical protein